MLLGSCRHTAHDYLTGGEVNEEQHIVGGQSLPRPYFGGEKIGSPKHGLMLADKARPGGVLFHCIRGHDRTGIITLLLLALVGVTLDDIITDYELSPDPFRDELLVREHSSVRDAMLSALEGLNIDSYLRMGAGSVKMIWPPFVSGFWDRQFMY